MTKTRTLWGTEEPAKKKPIEFLQFARNKQGTCRRVLVDTSSLPDSYDHVVLLARSGAYPLDAMLAYDDANPEKGDIFFGHWNDGVVE